MGAPLELMFYNLISSHMQKLSINSVIIVFITDGPEGECKDW